MIIALFLTLLLVLTVLRHLVEPACPGCAAKRWRVEGDALSCMSCGWDTATAPTPAQTAVPQLPGGRFATAP